MPLNDRSLKALKGVHRDLVVVVQTAITMFEAANPGMSFIVTEGLRTPERQRQLLAARATRTLKSRHLTGHAVDLAVTVGGEVRWDWPLYDLVAAAMKGAAAIHQVPIVWGGDWVSFKDGPHFELSHSAYPAEGVKK